MARYLWEISYSPECLTKAYWHKKNLCNREGGVRGQVHNANNIVIGENGLAFVPDDDSTVRVRFNTTGFRTFLDITWPGRSLGCSDGDEFTAERGNIRMGRDQNGNVTTMSEYTAFFTDQNRKKGASLSDNSFGVTDAMGEEIVGLNLNQYIASSCTPPPGPSDPLALCFVVHLHPRSTAE